MSARHSAAPLAPGGQTAAATPRESSHDGSAPIDRPHDLRLSVVIPVYNEAATVETLLQRVWATGLASEVIVVDDGSTDGTADILRRLDGRSGLAVIHHGRNRGKGAALCTAFDHVAGDVVIIQDADLEYDPADYSRLLRPLIDDEADVVFGTRFGRGRGSMPRWRYAGNRALTWLSNRFTGLRLADMESGYKVFRRDVLLRIAPELREQGFGIEPELTAKVAAIPGVRVAQQPIAYRPRPWSEGKKIGWRDGLRALWCIIKNR
jgi:glycosyltransferase involved in cell wall biosynthesis